MKNLPIKNEIRERLKKIPSYNGVLGIKGHGKYLKLTSKIGMTFMNNRPVKINPNNYANFQDALEDTLTCAKVYKKLVDIGFYHSQTSIAICKDGEGNLALMVVMPALDVKRGGRERTLLEEKIEKIEKQFNLKDRICEDMKCRFNWGYDQEGNFYAHDLHIATNYHDILKFAKRMGIK